MWNHILIGVGKQQRDLAWKTKKQIDVNHIHEGIGRGHKPAGQDQGEQRDGNWRTDKKAQAATERIRTSSSL
jgi:hypothetical protein